MRTDSPEVAIGNLAAAEFPETVALVVLAILSEATHQPVTPTSRIAGWALLSILSECLPHLTAEQRATAWPVVRDYLAVTRPARSH